MLLFGQCFPLLRRGHAASSTAVQEKEEESDEDEDDEERDADADADDSPAGHDECLSGIIELDRGVFCDVFQVSEQVQVDVGRDGSVRSVVERRRLCLVVRSSRTKPVDVE